MRILVIEDDAVGGKVLRLFLQSYGDIDIATEGEEAYQQFIEASQKKSPFDLVLLDIGLPGRGGLDILRDIRKYEVETRVAEPVAVIMLTGNTGEEQIAAARSLGAVKYLLKPVLESELLNQLRDLGLITDSK